MYAEGIMYDGAPSVVIPLPFAMCVCVCVCVSVRL